MKADVWCEGLKGGGLADPGGETGHVLADHFIRAEHVPRGNRAHTVQGTVLQDGTGVCAGTRPLRRPHPLDSRLCFPLLAATAYDCGNAELLQLESGPGRPRPGPTTMSQDRESRGATLRR